MKEYHLFVLQLRALVKCGKLDFDLMINDNKTEGLLACCSRLGFLDYRFVSNECWGISRKAHISVSISSVGGVSFTDVFIFLKGHKCLTYSFVDLSRLANVSNDSWNMVLYTRYGFLTFTECLTLGIGGRLVLKFN